MTRATRGTIPATCAVCGVTFFSCAAELARGRKCCSAACRHTKDYGPEAAKARIMKNVTVSDAGCWVWTAWINNKGYGYMSYRGRPYPAHRAAWEVFRGEQLERGIDVDHLCRNTLCVNPEHLEPVTHRENIRRGKAATKTACKRGHDWTDPKNVYFKNTGRRYCAVCTKELWS